MQKVKKRNNSSPCSENNTTEPNELFENTEDSSCEDIKDLNLIKEETDFEEDEEEIDLLGQRFRDEGSGNLNNGQFVSFTNCNYICNDIRDHKQTCECSTPRLHSYILSGHQCNSSCSIKSRMVKKPLRSDMKAKELPDTDAVSEPFEGAIIESEVSESEFKNIVKGETIWLKDDTPHTNNPSQCVEDSEVKKFHSDFKTLNSKSLKRRDRLKIKSTLFSSKISNPKNRYKNIKLLPLKKNLKLLVDDTKVSDISKSDDSHKISNTIPDKDIVKTPSPDKNSENNTLKKRKNLFRINKNGTFHSFNQNFITISSVSTLKQISEEKEINSKEGEEKLEPTKFEINDEHKLNCCALRSCDDLSLGTRLNDNKPVYMSNSSEVKADPLISDEVKAEPHTDQCIKSEGKGAKFEGNLPDIDGSPLQENVDDKLPLSKPEENQTIEKLAHCNLCRVSFPTFLELIDHLEIHQKEGAIFCYYCQKSFGDKTTMKRHMRTHTGEKPYRCTICDKRFSLPGNFKKHRDIHEDVRTEECDICGRMFRRKEHLKQHRLTHTGEKPFKCSLCSACFTARYSLQIHMNNHLGRKPFTCSYCGKSFADKSTMKKHIRIHTGERPYNCSICNKAFSESGSLTTHITTHSQERPFSCEQCSIAFKTSKSLRQHLKIHYGDKQFACKYCGMLFIQKYNMVMHERIHTGEKPYECFECSRTFRSRSCLGKHIVLHGGDKEKKYSCGYCEKKFHRKAHLERHISTHMGIKNFECSICFKKFSIKSSLKKHVQTFHSQGARSFPCLNCGRVFKRSVYVATHKCSGPTVKEEPLSDHDV